MKLSCATAGDAGGPATLLLHGWGCDHSFFAPQFEHFARTSRVLAPDLPGHGRSLPIDDPSVVNIGRAIIELCDAQRVTEALVVGHSMGGVIALELSLATPHLVAALVLVDTVLWRDVEVGAIEALAKVLEAGKRDEALDITLQTLVQADDDQSVADRFRSSFKSADFKSLSSCFRNHLLRYDPNPAADALRKPVAYIGSENPFTSFATLKNKLPQIKTGQVIGSGHFAPLLVPGQVNAMIDGFLARCYADKTTPP